MATKVIITLTQADERTGSFSITTKRGDENSKLYSLSKPMDRDKWALVSQGEYVASYGRISKAIEKVYMLS